MSSEFRYISAGKEQLHYLKWGSGERLLLAFHGYGDNAEQYQPLEPYLAEEYTVLSFDLPHHSRSKWKEDTVLAVNDLVVAVDSLMAEYRVEKVSLIGYSIGGRVCLAILECKPAVIDKLTLLATDGLTANSYFYFFTRTSVGKKMFRNLLQRPGPYFRIMNWLKALKLVDVARHKFVMHFLQSDNSRNFLLHVWPAMRDIIPHQKKLKAAIRKYKIPVSIFMGAYDKIMPASIARKFKTGLDTVQLCVLNKGHRVLDNENAQQIAESLL